MSFLQSRIYPYHLDFVLHVLILYCLKYKLMLSIHNINCMITSTPPPTLKKKKSTLLAFIKYQYLPTGRKIIEARPSLSYSLFSVSHYFVILLFYQLKITFLNDHSLKSFEEPHLCRVILYANGSDSKESVCNAGHTGSIPGIGRSSGEGNGNPLQYSYLEKSMEKRTWRATIHGVAKS